MTAHTLTLRGARPRLDWPSRLCAILTNVGRQILSGRLLNTAPGAGNPGASAPRYVAWGTGSTAEAASQTALATASAEARTAGTDTQQTTSVTNDTYRVVGAITSAGSQTIAEAGLFDASTSGNMLIRGVFTGIPVVASDVITFTFNLQFT